MQKTLDLTQLSHAKKDALICQLQEQLMQTQEQLVHMQERLAAMQKIIDDLQSRLSLNSRNSSKPPSSDGLNKPKPKSLRPSGQKPSGGQKGHPGNTLARTNNPDEIITHEIPLICDHCRRPLASAEVVQSRQVFDIPRPQLMVTEHRILQTTCACGKTHRSRFPAEVEASLQYGPRLQAAMVYLNQYQLLPLQRTADLLRDVCGVPVSQATVQKACVISKTRLLTTTDAIKNTLRQAPVLHVDESGLRVNKTLQWLHVAVTPLLTWMQAHEKRGQEAFTALNVLPDFRGILVHDGWIPYRSLNCTHGLCNAHHLRELTYVYEELKQAWAKDLMDLLVCAQQQKQALSRARLEHMRFVYEAILDEGEKENPRALATGKKGRTKQTKAANLIHRLRTQAEDVWRFATVPEVPFTNNLAEQAIRMPKVKQKISGGFRTQEGLEIFCVVRSYLATMRKQGANLFDCLVQTFQNEPTQPQFA